MPNNQITITINGVTHKFQTGDVDAMRDLPWSERKQLIELLENIKQAEYVQAEKPTELSTDAGFNSNSSPIPQSLTKNTATQVNQSSKPPQFDAVKLDPEIKASEKDVDDLMTRLILEQKKKHQPIPDKSSVIKLLLLVFAIIIVLAAIF